MATNNMVPYSNKVGNNQTTPGAGAPAATSTSIVAPKAAENSFVPAAAATAATATTGATATTSTVPSVDSGGKLGSQLTDIYGSGVGGSLDSLINSMSGTNSVVLQDYINSLVPQEAKAQSNLDMSLGAGGAGSNSSVAAIGNANLQAQETAAIAGESASLIKDQEHLTAEMLMGIAPTAAQQVSDSSALNVFGQVLGDVGSVVSTAMGLSEVTGGAHTAAGTGSFGGASPVPSSLGSTGANDLPNYPTYA